MFGAAMVAPHDIDGAVLEARRCVEELGFKAVFLAPGCVNGRPWHHPAYDPLWAEIERLDVPLSFHGGGQTYLTPDFSLQVLDKLMLWHTFNQPLAIQFCTVSLCGGGVLERFPNLRVALLEGNCSWAPWLLDRLDEHYEWTGWYEGDRPHDEAVGVLPPPVLPRRRGRGGHRRPLPRLVRRRQPRLLHRLPARRLAVPARRRHLRQAARSPTSRRRRSAATTGSASTRSPWSSTPEPPRAR